MAIRCGSTAARSPAMPRSPGTRRPSATARTPCRPRPVLSAALTSPAAGATVSGTVAVGMSASGGIAPYTYTLTLDGSPLTSGGATTYSWSTTTASNGGHTLGLTVRDNIGATATASRTVTVQNGAALSAAITAPANGATVSGPVTVTAAAAGGTSPYTYAFSVDGTQVASGAAASYAWNSAGVVNGAHTLGVTVTDAAGVHATAGVGVTVTNGTPPPPTGTLKVFITSPSNGATVSGTSWVTLWLNGAAGASNVYTLTVAGQTVATTTTASTGPVSLPWSTSAVADGAQTLTASARDATGNTGAASIAITVANGGTPPPPPPALTASFTSPAAGATVSGTVSVNIWVEGAVTGNHVFTLRAAGTAVGSATDSGAHVTLPWNTPGTPNGATSLSATVQDASGNSGSTSIPVTVGN